MFSNLKVGTKLVSGFLALVFIGSIVAVIGIFNMSRINDLAGNMYERELIALSNIKEANINLIYIGRARGNVLLATSSQERQANLENIRKYNEKLVKHLQIAEPLFVSEEAKQIFKEYAKVSDDYSREMRKVFELSENTQYAERTPELAAALAETRKHANILDEMLTKLATQKEVRAKSAAEETIGIYKSSEYLMIALTICSAIFGVVVGMLITRNLTGQLGGEPRQASDIAAAIAGGDLSVKIETKAGDQSSMLFAMKKMRDSLSSIVAEVRAGTDTIATASAQVAAGSLDLSSRTEQQASSLEETASSMEELTSTVKGNADNARQANMLATEASSVALKGGEVINEVVDTMGQINDSAKKIVDIISVIDGIAFQTNILALNAAVEAARAGEQGRGFAVVASEVRTLAQRSASAAKEIKALIGDSVDKVDTGTKLVAQAGSTMHEIVESVKHVTDIMAEISSASQEQTAGIDQINQAVAQMDQVTQQNAALVEEAAAASESMQEQAAHLAGVVSVFKLDAASVPPSTKSVEAKISPKNARTQSRQPRPMLISSVKSSRNSNASDNDNWEQF